MNLSHPLIWTHYIWLVPKADLDRLPLGRQLSHASESYREQLVSTTVPTQYHGQLQKSGFKDNCQGVQCGSPFASPCIDNFNGQKVCYFSHYYELLHSPVDNAKTLPSDFIIPIISVAPAIIFFPVVVIRVRWKLRECPRMMNQHSGESEHDAVSCSYQHLT